jgi:hypothetical protein
MLLEAQKLLVVVCQLGNLIPQIFIDLGLSGLEHVLQSYPFVSLTLCCIKWTLTLGPFLVSEELVKNLIELSMVSI